MFHRINEIMVDHGNQYITSCNHRISFSRADLSIGNRLDDSFCKGRNLRYIIDGEKVCCFRIKIPKGRMLDADSIVRKSIADKFVSIDNILYDYQMCITGNGKADIFIYCVNAKGTILLNKELVGNIHIKSVNTYQNMILKYAKRKIKRWNSVVIAGSINYVYIIITERGRMVEDYIFPYNKAIKMIKEAMGVIQKKNTEYGKLYVLNKPFKLGNDIINCLEADYEACILS